MHSFDFQINNDGTVSKIYKDKVLTSGIPLSHVASQLAPQLPMDTGFLPDGVRSISRAGSRMQIIIERKPEISPIIWGRYEHDKDAKTYHVAQPYRVIIADFENMSLLGARMFYSPVPINTPDQILYNINLPNTNIRGYGPRNSLGWICLYNKYPPFQTIAQAVNNVIYRCDGGEAYNDRNMSTTDGARFYQINGYPKYLWDPAEWEKKTDEEGLDWVLDESNWIPARVKGIDSQDKHNDTGELLTIGMAAEGGYQATYHENERFVRRTHQLARQGNAPSDSTIYGYLKQAVANALAVNFDDEKAYPGHGCLYDKSADSSLCVHCDKPTTLKRQDYNVCQDCRKTWKACLSCKKELEKKHHFTQFNRQRVCDTCRPPKEEENLAEVKITSTTEEATPDDGKLAMTFTDLA